MKTQHILLFGTSLMAGHYAAVLKSLQQEVVVVGRDVQRLTDFAKRWGFLPINRESKDLAVYVRDAQLIIIASAIESLSEVMNYCLEAGATRILVEKPGALNLDDLENIQKLYPNAEVKIAYNRRYYNSLLSLRDHIKDDGGVLGCCFDFTDREKDILLSTKDVSVISKWGWANSSHVIDTAFYLIGLPTTLVSFQQGGYSQHPNGNMFSGAGKSGDIVFSYMAGWASGGRWLVDIMTTKGRYRLSPMEQLQFCAKNQFEWQECPPKDQDDSQFKPGLYKMVVAALSEEGATLLPNIQEQILLGKIINKIFKYEE